MRIALIVVFAVSATAQWLDHVDPKIPRTRDGKLNLSAPAPKTNGKPDLSGTWAIGISDPREIERLFPGIGDLTVVGDDPRFLSKYFIDFFVDFKQEDVPIRPAALESFMKNLQSSRDNPSTKCLPQSVPRADLLPTPIKIIQTPGHTAMLYEIDSNFREIYTDGRKLPENTSPSWLGYSVGKWEGDVFIVETAGFNDRGWIDAIGHPRSEKMRLEERFRRRDFGHMDLQITLDDPGMYTKPVTIKVTLNLVPNGALLENVCNENEKDRVHMDKE